MLLMFIGYGIDQDQDKMNGNKDPPPVYAALL